jgi:hypothetical protein
MIEPLEPISQRLFSVAEHIYKNAPGYQDVWLAMLAHVTECPPDDWWAKANILLAEQQWLIEFEVTHRRLHAVINQTNVSEVLRAQASVLDAMLLGSRSHSVDVAKLQAAILVCESTMPIIALNGLTELAWQLRTADPLQAAKLFEKAIDRTSCIFGAQSIEAAAVMASASQFDRANGNINRAKARMKLAMAATPDTVLGQQKKLQLQSAMERWLRPGAPEI